MFPSLPFGPFSLPTGPVVLLIAVFFGLEMAGRYGRRLQLAADDVWNAGLLALITGVVVARLWNVFEFWPVYRDEPGLLLSLRPSGFVLLPGVIGALVATYLYLLRRALDPVRVAAAFAVGGIAGAIVFHAGALLTGTILGMRTEGPWGLPYFGEMRHPVALYQAGCLWLLFVLLWLRSRRDQPGRTVLYAVLGYSLIRLWSDAFIDEPALLGSLRLSQVIALAVALVVTLLLARGTAQPVESETVEP